MTRLLPPLRPERGFGDLWADIRRSCRRGPVALILTRVAVPTPEGLHVTWEYALRPAEVPPPDLPFRTSAAVALDDLLVALLDDPALMRGTVFLRPGSPHPLAADVLLDDDGRRLPLPAEPYV